MRRDTRDVVKTVAMGVVAMLALPVAYRIWITYNPPAPSRTFSEIFAVPEDVRAEALLKTPAGGWTERDRQLEPTIYEWLGAHGRTVLPWEWTDVARTKDPDGYRNVWTMLFREREDALEDAVSDIDRELRRLNAAVRQAETLYSHATGQLERVTACLATNTYPAEVEIETLAKGRLWGWNRKREVRVLGDAEEARNCLDGIAAVASSNLAESVSAKAGIAGLSATREIKDALRAEAEALRRSGTVPSNACQRLIVSIRAK